VVQGLPERLGLELLVPAALGQREPPELGVQAQLEPREQVVQDLQEVLGLEVPAPAAQDQLGRQGRELLGSAAILVLVGAKAP
jgi:hypothetical protein